jgi:hypothetical protein
MVQWTRSMGVVHGDAVHEGHSDHRSMHLRPRFYESKGYAAI